MKDLSNATGIGSDADFLNGDLVDLQTKVNAFINQDPVQFFQKLMNLSKLSPNGNFDNEANGYQLIEALRKFNDALIDTTTEDLIARVFPMNIVIVDIPTATFQSVDYPYNGDFNAAKFSGIVSYKKSGVFSVIEIDVTSAAITDLAAGLIIADDINLKITAFETYLKIENIIPAAISIENLSCSINVNAITKGE